MRAITYQELADEAIEKYKLPPSLVLSAMDICDKVTMIYNKNCPPGCYDVRAYNWGKAGWYRVDTNAKTCTCKTSQRGDVCKHRIAVWIYTQQLARTYSQLFPRSNPDTILKELGYT